MIPLEPTNIPTNVYLVDFNVQERINVSISDSKNIDHLKKPNPMRTLNILIHLKCINLINQGLQFLFVQLPLKTREIYS